IHFWLSRPTASTNNPRRHCSDLMLHAELQTLRTLSDTSPVGYTTRELPPARGLVGAANLAKYLVARQRLGIHSTSASRMDFPPTSAVRFRAPNALACTKSMGSGST